MSVSEQPVAYNPFEPGFTDNPYPQFAALRAADPVHQTVFGPWLVFGYDDVNRVLRDPALSVEERHAHPTPLSEIADSVDRQERGTDAMLNRDPPDHTRLRRLVSKAFTPRTIQRFRERVQELVDASLDRAAAAGEIELMRDFAFPLPFTVITDMLGMPDIVDPDEVRDLSGTIVRTLEPVVDPEVVRAVDAAGTRLYELLGQAIEAKRAAPADDLLSALIAAEEDGDKLSHGELIDQVSLLYVAGHETTVNLIGNGALALLRHPDQLAWLRADPPGRIQGAVEELLRYDSPVQMSRRITTTEVDVGGRTIEPGAFVIVALASANRDEAHFGPTAATLDLTRPDASTHLSFGGGHHYCLGAALARLEAQLAISTLVTRFPTITLAATPTYNGRINLRGLANLPLTLST